MTQIFGADLAGSDFDFKAFITRPSVIVRLLSLIFSIIVFGCISNGGYFRGVCMYNRDVNACNYGIGIGVIAFLACIGFLIGEALFPRLSNIDQRKTFVILDIAFSGLWSFLWFVGFCYLTNRWSNTKIHSYENIFAVNDLRGAISFCFFSIFTWGIQCYLAIKQYRDGVGELSASSDDVLDNNRPYSGSAGSGTIPDPMGGGGGSGGSGYYDDKMIGGDLSGGGVGGYQQHY